jgi:hypothetical protein
MSQRIVPNETDWDQPPFSSANKRFRICEETIVRLLQRADAWKEFIPGA